MVCYLNSASSPIKVSLMRSYVMKNCQILTHKEVSSLFPQTLFILTRRKLNCKKIQQHTILLELFSSYSHLSSHKTFPKEICILVSKHGRETEVRKQGGMSSVTQSSSKTEISPSKKHYCHDFNSWPELIFMHSKSRPVSHPEQ